MKIFRSVKTNILTQSFYENKNDIYTKWGMKWHGGFDWATKQDEKCYFDCSCSGFVLNTEIDNNGGLGINIITEENGKIYKHRYWHLKSFNVVAGQRVETGDLLGITDTTGYSTGNHLHRDVKEMIKENGIYKIKNYDNGSFGTIDYSFGTIDYGFLFVNIFVKDYMANLQGQLSILQKLIKIIEDFLKGR